MRDLYNDLSENTATLVVTVVEPLEKRREVFERKQERKLTDNQIILEKSAS